ncbi:MAG: VOC family protein [Methanobacterium sp.]|jgi:catechol 2,3-dioxygenase-like lactoylglutathione lyase family enzyme
MTKKIESVTIGIAVKDVKEATKWYKALLGDVEIMEPDPGTIELKLTDNVWLQLDDTGYLEVDGGSTIIRFQTDDIESAHKLAKRITPDVEDIIVVEGVIKYFDFKDPAGNRLSYVQLL